MWSKLRKNYRRAIAFMLIVAMTFTNVGTNLTIAFAAGEEENSLFLLSGDDIREAIEDAVDSGDVFDFASLSMKAKSKSLLTSYQKLIGGKQGAVYELDVEVDDRYAAEDTSLSVFYNAGTEDVVFLFVNESDMVMTFRANVDGYETARITVNPNTANVDTDEEDLSFAEDYSDTTMIDDETKKVTGEVVKPTETESGVSDETDSVPEKDTEISGENNAADENTDQSSEADSETEDVTEADKASEAETGAASETEASTEAETDSAPEIEKTTEAVPETETEAETEAASETEADEPDDAMDGELLGISNHKVFRVATSEIIDEEETPEAEDKAVVEEIPTTEPETEAATEASEEETKAEITEETSAPAEESSEAIEETTEPSKESSAAEESSAADETSPADESSAADETSAAEETSAADETLTDNTVKDETGAPSDGNASNDTITPDASDDVNTSAPPHF